MFVRSRQVFSCFAVFLFLNAAAISLHAADAEERAFNMAQKQFDDGFYELAEKSLAEFVGKYPASPRVSQALLTEARAALAQNKFSTAIALLTTNISNAAGIADQFQLAIARSYFTNGNFEAAAQNYAQLVAKHTNSTLRLTATLEEAVTRMKLRQWSRVTTLLENPAGVFQQAVARTPDGEAVVDGRLLLAEALIEQHRLSEAEQVANVISDTAVTTQSRWRREHLRARAQFAAQKLEVALGTASNLVLIAAAARQPALEAAAVALEGEILEALNQPILAIAVYEQNRRPGVPSEQAREALFRIVELIVEQGQLTNALARLQDFLNEHPNEKDSDVALVALAELRLKQYQLLTTGTNAAPDPVATANLLFLTIADCEKVSTNSPFASKAQLVRAWALLAQGKPGESLSSFRSAADLLPWSEAQAVARFKTADLEFQSDDVTNALRHYRRVISDYQSLSRVQSELVPRARYQMLQASQRTGDLAAAEEVLRAMLREYPPSVFAERSLLLLGQAADELGDTSKARKIFAESAATFPGSSLRPEVELAVARTFERERDWASAVSQYEHWITAFPTNENLPTAEFNRAMATFLSGQDTNALVLFTNFVARFPKHTLAARAQDWIGDFYFRRGQFELAERNYQLVYQDRPNTPLIWQAKLKAGRAALLRPSFDNATNYFVNLINAEHCPTSIVVQAYFAYGNAYLDRPTTNALENFREALAIYRQVPQFFPDDPFKPRAWGQMAMCHFQLGSVDAANYADAMELYQKITNASTADLSTREQAQVGMGHVFRRQSELAHEAGQIDRATALLDSAVVNYTNVLYTEPDGETPDQVWIKEAAINAAAILESQRKWDRALNVYLRLSEKLPALREQLARKIANARDQWQKQSAR
jgi:TolA-binding protein